MKSFDINTIANDINNIVKAKPGLIKKIGIFGSIARGNFHGESDIDLLVEYINPPDFTMQLFARYCEMCSQIEESLAQSYQCKVDIVHIENGSLAQLDDENVENEVYWI